MKKAKNYKELLNLENATKVWDLLGDIPVNDNDDLDEDFNVVDYNIIFKKGTDKFEVWHWVEEKFNISIAEELMFIN